MGPKAVASPWLKQRGMSLDISHSPRWNFIPILVLSLNRTNETKGSRRKNSLWVFPQKISIVQGWHPLYNIVIRQLNDNEMADLTYILEPRWGKDGQYQGHLYLYVEVQRRAWEVYGGPDGLQVAKQRWVIWSCYWFSLHLVNKSYFSLNNQTRWSNRLINTKKLQNAEPVHRRSARAMFHIILSPWSLVSLQQGGIQTITWTVFAVLALATLIDLTTLPSSFIWNIRQFFICRFSESQKIRQSCTQVRTSTTHGITPWESGIVIKLVANVYMLTSSSL